MVRTEIRSMLAVLLGLAAIFALSYGTDAVLESTGVLPRGALPVNGTPLLTAGVLAYRLLYSVLGCGLAARLAPAHPMRHAFALGGLGVLGSTAGALGGQGLAPGWYLWGLVLFALPCAWVGGRLGQGKAAGKPA